MGAQKDIEHDKKNLIYLNRNQIKCGPAFLNRLLVAFSFLPIFINIFFERKIKSQATKRIDFGAFSFIIKKLFVVKIIGILPWLNIKIIKNWIVSWTF